MNKQILAGNIGKDAEVKDFNNGNSVINFSVADTKKWTDKQGQKQEKTNWVDCVWYTNNTSIAQYLKKGMKVLIEGEPSSRAYINNENQAVSINQCIVRNLEFMSSANQQQQTQGYAQQNNNPTYGVNQNYGQQQGSFPPAPSFEQAPEDDFPF